MLVSIPRVAAKTAAILLGELGAIRTFENARQLAGYCGLTPRERQSVSSAHKKSCLSRMGNGSGSKSDMHASSEYNSIQFALARVLLRTRCERETENSSTESSHAEAPAYCLRRHQAPTSFRPRLCAEKCVILQMLHFLSLHLILKTASDTFIQSGLARVPPVTNGQRKTEEGGIGQSCENSYIFSTI